MRRGDCRECIGRGHLMMSTDPGEFARYDGGPEPCPYCDGTGKAYAVLRLLVRLRWWWGIHAR